MVLGLGALTHQAWAQSLVRGTKVSQAMKVKESEVVQSHPTLCDPVVCSSPGSSVHGILQATILEWVAISFSRGSSQPRDWTRISCIAGRHFILWATREPTLSLQFRMFNLINLYWSNSFHFSPSKQRVLGSALPLPHSVSRAPPSISHST